MHLDGTSKKHKLILGNCKRHNGLFKCLSHSLMKTRQCQSHGIPGAGQVIGDIPCPPTQTGSLPVRPPSRQHRAQTIKDWLLPSETESQPLTEGVPIRPPVEPSPNQCRPRQQGCVETHWLGVIPICLLLIVPTKQHVWLNSVWVDIGVDVIGCGPTLFHVLLTGKAL